MIFSFRKYGLKVIPVMLMAGILFSCKNKIEEIRALTDVQNLPVQTTTDVEYFYSEIGVLKNKLTASQLDRYTGDDSRVEASGGFKMEFYDSLERKEAELSANRGVFIESQGLMTAQENVVFFNVNGDSLQTEELIWQQDSAMIYTDKFCKISTQDGVIYSQGLESNESFTNYSLKNITGDLYIDENKEKDDTED